MRVVLDTNVLLSGAIAKAGPISQIMTAWSRFAFDVVVSRPIMDEVTRNINSAYFAARLSPLERQDHLRTIAVAATQVLLPSNVLQTATHPEDDLILATSVAGTVDYLVTGDRQLLALGSHDGIPIVSPVNFAGTLEEHV